MVKDTSRTRIAPAVLLLLLCAACGPDARQKALSHSLTALNAARDGFVTWDEAHQMRIVQEAESFEEGRAKLDAYRKKREVVLHSFSVAYSALATAALSPGMEMLTEAMGAAMNVYKLIKELTGGDVKTPTPEGG